MQKKTELGKRLKNAERAITNGRIVTIKDGRRIVKTYSSGDPLDGVLDQDNAPPFTGFVRDFGKRIKK